MSWGRRTTAGLLLVAAPLLTACGGEPVTPAPTLPMIPGADGPVPVAPNGTLPAAPATSDPSDPSGSETASGAIGDPDALFQRIGDAMSMHESVHLSVSTDGNPPVVEADHDYLDDNDYTAEITVNPDAPSAVVRVDGTTYFQLSADEPFAEVGVGDSSVGASLAGWNVVGDLQAVLNNADSFAASGEPSEIDGQPVESYTMSVDASFLVAGAQVPDDLTGDVEVTFSIAADGLPVRVEENFVDEGTVLSTDYSDWDVTVDAEAPTLG